MPRRGDIHLSTRVTKPGPASEERREGPAHGLTVAEVARLYRVGEDRVRGWISRGELFAINTSDATCKRPRYVVPAHALERFERGRAAARPKPAPRRKRKSHLIDFFPD
jgi:hypothetical protein